MTGAAGHTVTAPPPPLLPLCTAGFTTTFGGHAGAANLRPYSLGHGPGKAGA